MEIDGSTTKMYIGRTVKEAFKATEDYRTIVNWTYLGEVRTTELMINNLTEEFTDPTKPDHDYSHWIIVDCIHDTDDEEASLYIEEPITKQYREIGISYYPEPSGDEEQTLGLSFWNRLLDDDDVDIIEYNYKYPLYI